MRKSYLKEMTIGEAAEAFAPDTDPAAMSFDMFCASFASDLESSLRSRGFKDITTQHEFCNGNSVGGQRELKIQNGCMSARTDLTEIYKELKNGASYQDILRETCDNIAEILKDYSRFKDITDNYEKAKQYLIMELIPTEKNRLLLADCPHEDIQDLSVIYRLRFLESEEKHEIRSTVVTNELLSNWGINEATLKSDAGRLAPVNFPGAITPMSEVLCDTMGMTPEEFNNGEPEVMWVASNRSRVRGAGVIMYPGFLDEVCRKINAKSVFILPSSVHEVICISAETGQFSAKDLDDMVIDVNSSIVRPEEVLSDRAYFYDSTEKLFMTARDHDSGLYQNATKLFTNPSLLKSA